MRTKVTFALASLVLAACSADPPPAGTCTTDEQCSSAQRCVAGRCVARGSDGGMDGANNDAATNDSGVVDAIATDSGTDGAGGDACPSPRQCSATCCAMGQRCVLDRCVRDLGACAMDNECQSDSYCREGVCVPYGVPADRTNNATCRRTISIDSLRPSVQCRWSGPPMGDMHPTYNQAMSTPIVVDLDLDDDPATRQPSIVFATFPVAGNYGNPGVLRVIDGRDCTQQRSFSAANEAVVSTASPAAADLDGDGRPEIVAVAHGGGLLAFRWDPGTRNFVRWWRSGTCAMGGTRTPDTTGPANWGGPSIHDLDDDGRPEIIHGAVVYDRDGCILDGSQGAPAYSQGLIPVLADVDSDNKVELVSGNRILEWNPMTRRWVPETYFAGTSLAQGQVAIGNLGNYPLIGVDGLDGPEVVVVSAGTVRVQTLEGRVVFGPFAIPGGGTGGPPTIADFDGDGRAEFATAGGTRYVVYDLDCVMGGDATRCNGMARTDGILWSQPSQDGSSNVTGSSVFDFDADGRAEAVYADECYLRVYEGRTGRVVYSSARSSGTAYENPVIADVDGDFRSEIVSTVNDYAGTLGCAATDPLFPMASFMREHGVVVLRDEMDRWAASRPIWNQHAYHVTHVDDDGRVPSTSMVRRNWATMGLNNFRQNVQGSLAALGVPDLTVTADPGPLVLMCVGERGTLRARVCNRGTLPAPPGVRASFRVGDAMGAELCAATVSGAIAPGACQEATCEAMFPPRSIDVHVVVNPAPMALDECLSGNNSTAIRAVFCGTPG
ncbi:MAG: VCBS repeat-containing protein [Myxococcales bacterium]|nr:VCBS repeat-containing protein [Myxococcales bacterium]